MRLLCTADLHMGRRSTRLPDAADAAACSCTAVWERIVDHAVDAAVDAVLLAGDVVDRKNRYFEAIGPLERGIRRLADARIPVVAVAGNHDYDVLPPLADALGADALRLVGRGGRWERVVIETARAGALAVDGWSFPHERVAEDPLGGYGLDAAPAGTPLVGMLHADLDQPGSSYAPVALTDLRRLPASFWLLGHIHSPALLDGADADGFAAPVLYPGSPQAMDPGEPGAHGAWLVELEPGEAPSARRVPLSTVRYETVPVDLDGVADEEEARRRLVDGVRAVAEAAVAVGGPLRWLSCRVELTGRTPLHRRLDAVLAGAAEDLALTVGDLTARVERIEIGSRPALDLHSLARGRDPCGVLARALLVALDGDDADAALNEPYRELMRTAVQAAAETHGAAAYRGLADPPPSGPEVRALLRERAWALLDALHAQREVEA